MKVAEGTKWIKFNRDQVGFYRVNYPVDDWKKLGEALVSDLEKFSVADRAHLLNDAFTLAQSTQLNYDIALDLTKYLEKETKNVPWNVAANQLAKIRNLMASTENLSKFTVSSLLNLIIVKVTSNHSIL